MAVIPLFRRSFRVNKQRVRLRMWFVVLLTILLAGACVRVRVCVSVSELMCEATGLVALMGFAVTEDNMNYRLVGLAAKALPLLGFNEVNRSYRQVYTHSHPSAAAMSVFADSCVSVWWSTFNYQELMPSFSVTVLIGQIFTGAFCQMMFALVVRCVCLSLVTRILSFTS